MSAYGLCMEIGQSSIRLPMPDDCCEEGCISHAPYFNNGSIDPSSTVNTEHSPLKAMAWLILIVTIWEDIKSFAGSSTYLPQKCYENEYRKFHERTRTALQYWDDMLPTWLGFEVSDARDAGLYPYRPLAAFMHILCYRCSIKLHFCLVSDNPAALAPAVHSESCRYGAELLQYLDRVSTPTMTSGTAGRDRYSYGALILPLPISSLLRWREYTSHTPRAEQVQQVIHFANFTNDSGC